MKKIIISIAAGFATLSLGLAIFYTGQFIVSMFQTSEENAIETVKVEEIEPQVIPVEELIYPKPAQTETNEQETETTEPEDESEFTASIRPANIISSAAQKKDFKTSKGFISKPQIIKMIRIQEVGYRKRLHRKAIFIMK